MDPEPLSPYLGDYPDGMYWSAVRPGGTKAPDEVDEVCVLVTVRRAPL